MSDVAKLKMEFLMKLQQGNYEGAQVIQRELLKLIPKDPVIKEFSKFLPAEIEYQRDAELEAKENEIEYYGEEESEEEEDEYGLEMEELEKKKEQGESTAADTEKESVMPKEEGEGQNVEEEKKGEDEKSVTDGSEYDSEYDEQGRYIWGKEGADWEFYYDEDKIAYELGQSTVPETLNPQALPNDDRLTYDLSHATGVAKPVNREFEAKYPKAKKKKKLSVGNTKEGKDDVDAEYEMLARVAGGSRSRSPCERAGASPKPSPFMASTKAGSQKQNPFGGRRDTSPRRQAMEAAYKAQQKKDSAAGNRSPRVQQQISSPRNRELLATAGEVAFGKRASLASESQRSPKAQAEYAKAQKALADAQAKNKPAILFQANKNDLKDLDEF